jgi:predicted nucleic acid-binding protein
VEAIQAADVEAAATLADEHSELDARDLLHAAVMARLGSTQIVSADKGFDRIPQIERLDPAHVGVWRGMVE